MKCGNIKSVPVAQYTVTLLQGEWALGVHNAHALF